MDVSEPASISTGIASRYATAAFELANEAGDLAGLESDVEALSQALEDSAELRAVISSPIYSREDTGNAAVALAKAMGLSETVANTLALMGAKGRLFVLPAFVRALRERIAEAKGEVTAEVTAAKALTKAQQEKLAGVLKAAVGKDVNINLAVDDALIGGLVVKVGSRMIDTSIASKLANLQNAMKEVG
ncbi:F0F1 ATP synthase subunit delta [Brevirhabdus pacifica]|uniref:ATP synthase subunit delta n=1 Tax=Brevirhabdus pacifica TaxID=1267768 RepID=A0A1U7DM87_9RHOB|nr:F0F1 ATP synthase subunit delta [Brevirhabdus pacifica]OWU76922.1 ATP synthase F0F1 subunit delta [Loktanella sp. 22II-4b]